MSITNGDSEYTDEDNDILPPILSSHPPSSLLTANIAMPYLPLVPLPPQQTSSKLSYQFCCPCTRLFNVSGTTSSSYVPLPPTLSVPQIFSYTSASSYSQASSCISVPSVPQDSSGIPSVASNYISTFTLPHHMPAPSFPFCPTVSSQPQDSSCASGSSLTQDLSLISRLPRWSSYVTSSTSLLSSTSYITTPSGCHRFYSQVSWPYPYPRIPHHSLHRLPSMENYKMTPSFHPYLPYPSSAAPYYPSTTTAAYPVYYNTNYRPNMQ